MVEDAHLGLLRLGALTEQQGYSGNIHGFYRVCMALSSDFASMLMMDAMAGSDRLSGEQACERLFAHAAFKAWSEKHGEALRKRIAL